MFRFIISFIVGYTVSSFLISLLTPLVGWFIATLFSVVAAVSAAQVIVPMIARLQLMLLVAYIRHTGRSFR